jgi:hypothetical protein
MGHSKVYGDNLYKKLKRKDETISEQNKKNRIKSESCSTQKILNSINFWFC